MLTRDALLAYAHFICIFALASLLVAELVILRKTLPADPSAGAPIDRWYGIAAGLVILSGLARLFLGMKVAVLPLQSGVLDEDGAVRRGRAHLDRTDGRYVRWGARDSTDGSIVLDDAEFARMRGLLWLQVGLFFSSRSARR